MNNFIIKNSDKYKEFFNQDFLMGPNCLRILDELLLRHPLTLSRDKVILDLGCGKGLTSLFIANETGATVYANDLWITKDENAARFREWKMERSIIPSCEDACCLSFEPESFDAVISVDSYHYFAGKEGFFKEKILPFVKKGGSVLIAVPGMKEEFEGRQEELLSPWLGDEFYMFHSCNWWKNIIGSNCGIESIETWEMSNAEIAWKEWLAQDSSFADGDRIYYESIIRKYTAFVGICVKK